MEETRYKTFSWNTHKKNWILKRPSVCQFELTFRCSLRCKHCYTNCYNRPGYLKKELNTQEVKLVLDKAYKAGVIWLCLTGGDPLTRRDFLNIYSYAKGKGFIITIFTNAYSMRKDIAIYLKNSPPFVIEVTLNAISEGVYEKISQVKGSFAKAMHGLALILNAKLPLKIKTQITRDSVGEIPNIKKFIQGLGLKFRPSLDLYVCLNGDLGPCNSRIPPQEVLNLNGKRHKPDSGCKLSSGSDQGITGNALFRCAIAGGDNLYVDPYGNTFPCNLIRRPAFNLIKVDIEHALGKLLPWAKNSKFSTNSKCRYCNLKSICLWCPGKAYIEKGNMEAPIKYYCELTKKLAKTAGENN